VISRGTPPGAGRLVTTVAALVLVTLAPAWQPPVDAQLAEAPGDRYAGLQWRFVRIRYHFLTEGTQIAQDFAGEPWFIDAPAADQNLSRRVKTATAIQVEDPIVLALDDPRLFQYPWIYFVEPGTLRLAEGDVPILREFLLRGGTAMFDDFHGPIEWESFAREMRRVFPDREIVEVPKDHPVFTSGFVPHLRTILDDSGRPMIFINWNTDMGDGWEWSNVAEFPGYVKYTAMAYQMAINEIIYSLTH
jgi:hypothetical protein